MKISPYCWMHLIVRTWFYVLFFFSVIELLVYPVCCMLYAVILKSTLAQNQWMHWIQSSFSYLQSSYHCSTYLSAQPDHCSTPSWYLLLICCHSLSKFHQSLISLCITSSLESTSCLIPPDVTLTNSPPSCSPLSPSITHSLFHSKFKTHLFHKSFPP